MKKRFPAIVLMLTIFCSSALGISTYQKTITATYGINLMIDGKSPTLTDATGNTVAPFVYEGTTYVPIRAVSENMGATVSYDSNTNTASVTSANATSTGSNDAIDCLNTMETLRVIYDQTLIVINENQSLGYIFVDASADNKDTSMLSARVATARGVLETAQKRNTSILDTVDSVNNYFQESEQIKLLDYLADLSEFTDAALSLCNYLDKIIAGNYTVSDINKASEILNNRKNLISNVGTPVNADYNTYYAKLADLLK